MYYVSNKKLIESKNHQYVGGRENGFDYDKVITDLEHCDTSLKEGQDAYILKLSKRKNDYDEYVVKAYKNGKYNEDATYYTDDWEDAVGTLRDIARRQGLTVNSVGTGYIAEKLPFGIIDSKKDEPILEEYSEEEMNEDWYKHWD